MEFSGGIVEFLKGKCILVTGSTGFLAKVFVEKVLRVQPNVKKIYLLIRAADAKSAAQRLQTEVTGKELFKVLKEKHGKGYQAFIDDKICPVPGDITEENLGITDSDLTERMKSEINVVLNVAATTNFNERYDVALAVNVLGAKHALQFAKQCARLELLLHVSTAYVSGAKEGLISEQKFQYGEAVNGTSGLDIDSELALVKETLKELQNNDKPASESETKYFMRDIGIKRAKHFGWSNTYVFTKAMGEMLLGQMRGDLPLVIIRPSIITSILRDPMPGWIEGIRTIDSLIVTYSKGKLDCFLGDLDLIMDVIPGDLVVNAMIVAMAAHANKPSETIYHVSSSAANPVKYAALMDCSHRYFTENPQFGKDGKIIKAKRIPVLNTMTSFRKYMRLRYKVPLQGLKFVNAAMCQLFSQKYSGLSRKYKFVMLLAELYEPFAFFRGSFDNSNLDKLSLELEKDESEEKMFFLDQKLIDWNKYLSEVHIPGVMKYVCH